MSRNLVVICGILVAILSGIQCDNAAQCNWWKKAAHQLSNGANTCHSTDSCNRLNCKGTYRYSSVLLPSSVNFELDYCFGMALNHCDDPVSIDVYLQVPKKNVSFVKRIHHDTQVQIPGLSFNIGSFGTLEVFLHFQMVKEGNSVSLSITAKCRVSTKLGLTMWPSRMQDDIVPEQHIPVGSCNHHVSSNVPRLKLQQCHAPKPGKHQPHTSATLHKTCSQKSSCSENEVCNLIRNKCQCNIDFQYNPSTRTCKSVSKINKGCNDDVDCGPNEQCTASRCECKKGYAYSSTRHLCDVANKGKAGGGKTTVHKPHAIPFHGTSHKSKSNKIPIIAGTVVGGVAFLIIVIVAGICVVRRFRRPYHGRELLLTSDDTDGIM